MSDAESDSLSQPLSEKELSEEDDSDYEEEAARATKGPRRKAEKDAENAPPSSVKRGKKGGKGVEPEPLVGEHLTEYERARAARVEENKRRLAELVELPHGLAGGVPAPAPKRQRQRQRRTPPANPSGPQRGSARLRGEQAPLVELDEHDNVLDPNTVPTTDSGEVRLCEGSGEERRAYRDLKAAESRAQKFELWGAVKAQGGSSDPRRTLAAGDLQRVPLLQTDDQQVQGCVHDARVPSAVVPPLPQQQGGRVCGGSQRVRHVALPALCRRRAALLMQHVPAQGWQGGAGPSVARGSSAGLQLCARFHHSARHRVKKTTQGV